MTDLAKIVAISKEELEESYLKEKQSSREIAKRFSCGKSTVLTKMKEFGINARGKSETSKMIKHPVKYALPEEELKRLYFNEKLSTYQIAEIYRCSPSAVYNKMKRYGIPLRRTDDAISLTIERRSKNIAATASARHERKNFSGSETEKAYLIGFRIGDLYVKKRRYGQTVVVQCTSTKKEQIDLIQSLFENYGYCGISKGIKGNRTISCYLNLSFNFLLKHEDEIEPWILNDDAAFASFLAGYIDAEGHFGVSNGFAVFSLGSYDKNILTQSANKLRKLGVEIGEPVKSVEGGFIDKRGVATNKDVWVLRTRKMKTLLQLIAFIKPCTKHAKRRKDTLMAEKNVLERLKREKNEKSLLDYANILH
ncbi:MAG: LAGLIDADG family homing endonuclease [Candidatus Micrarchaeota archaeon]